MVLYDNFKVHQEHAPGEWIYCNLCRSDKLAKRALSKAKRRQIEWPSAPEYSTAPVKDYHSRTTVDQVFQSMMQYIGSTSRQCAKYCCASSGSSQDKSDTAHRRRFHASKPAKKSTKNPLSAAEDVKIMIDPGTYAVSAGRWGEEQEQTHVVKLGQGQVVNLDFVV